MQTNSKTEAVPAAGASAAPAQAWAVPDFKTLFHSGKTAPWVVVIPVVNEGPRIRSLLEKMRNLGLPAQADILIVDGGTTDGSLEPDALRTLGVRTLLLKTGPGKLSAQLRCAYAFALREGYDGILTIDGNDKDNPAAIPAFIRALQDGADFVQASRFVAGGRAENTPRSRDLAIRLIHAPLLSLASGFHWTDTTQGFRAYSARLLRDPNVAPFRDIFRTYELLAYLSYRAPRLAYKCVELPTERAYPKTGAVPTKISSFRGNLEVLKILFAACLGKYNPPPMPTTITTASPSPGNAGLRPASNHALQSGSPQSGADILVCAAPKTQRSEDLEVSSERKPPEHDSKPAPAGISHSSASTPAAKTTILKEYPRPYNPAEECEPYYPINNPENNAIHQRYAQTLQDFPNVILCGRLAEYKYYNMDAVIESALACAEKVNAATPANP